MTRARRWTTLGLPVLLMVLATLSVATSAPMARAQDGRGARTRRTSTPGPAMTSATSSLPLSDVAELTGRRVFGSAEAVPVKESETEVEVVARATSWPRRTRSTSTRAPRRSRITSPAAISAGASSTANWSSVCARSTAPVTVGSPSSRPRRRRNGRERLPRRGRRPRRGREQAAAAAAATAAPAAAAEPSRRASRRGDRSSLPRTATEARGRSAPAAQEVPVDIRDFAFSPNPVEIAVGDTVDLDEPGRGPAHGDRRGPRACCNPGRSAPGASFSQTFEQAGEFPYFCEFHPNMTGTIVVQ